MQLIDLTMPLRPGMRGVEFETARRLDRDGWNALTVHLYSHAGTHMDAPSHFVDGAETIDQVALERCVGKAEVVDLTSLKPRESIMPQHLAGAERRILPGCRLLLHTGWSRNLGKEDYRTHFPRISLTLAQWLVQRGVVLVGVDCPSVADVNNLEELTAVHRAFLSAGVVIVEDLVNLDLLEGKTFQLIVLPLKLQGGDGSPARAVALVEDLRA